MKNLDLDTYMDCGLYVTKDDESYTHVPAGMDSRYFSLMVVASAKYTSEIGYLYRNQILYKYANGDIFTRSYYWHDGGVMAWGDWRRVTFTDELGISETEQRIGTWIDGSPLYKKAIVFNIPQNGNYSIPIDVSNFKNLVKWSGNFFQGGYQAPLWIMHIPYTYIDQLAPSDILNIYVYFDPNILSFRTSFYGIGQYSSGYYNGQGILYFEYTKNS